MWQARLKGRGQGYCRLCEDIQSDVGQKKKGLWTLGGFSGGVGWDGSCRYGLSVVGYFSKRGEIRTCVIAPSRYCSRSGEDRRGIGSCKPG